MSTGKGMCREGQSLLVRVCAEGDSVYWQGHALRGTVSTGKGMC